MVVKQQEHEVPTRQLRSAHRFATGGMATGHVRRVGPAPLQSPVCRGCTTDCRNCPWVDFWDYDQCGVTSSHMVGSARRQRG